MSLNELLDEAAEKIISAKHITAFTGAGISVESGVPPFRGKDGLWAKYDPGLFEISRFQAQPAETWDLLKEVFYDFFGKAKPNSAHFGLAKLEEMGFLKAVITQNVDSLHQRAGSTVVIEFHGTSYRFVCLNCGQRYEYDEKLFESMPPRCSACQGILKPDFIFFGEGIPQDAFQKSFLEAMVADIFLVIGTTGEVYPAAMVPIQAKQRGAFIIEINPEPSSFTGQITDIFLQGKAGEIMEQLVQLIIEKSRKDIS